MKPFLIAICFALACLCCAQAEAGPVRRVLGFVGGRARAAAVAPLRVLKAKPARRVAGWVLGR